MNNKDDDNKNIMLHGFMVSYGHVIFNKLLTARAIRVFTVNLFQQAIKV